MTDPTPTPDTAEAPPQPELLFDISREQIEALTAEAANQPDVRLLSVRETLDLQQRSVARSVASPEGFRYLFPHLGSKKRPKPTNKIKRVVTPAGEQVSPQV